jgi:hypothetical protein
LSPWQLARQIRYNLRLLAWPEAGGQLVFGAVHCTQGLPEESAHLLRMPFCLISVNEDEADAQNPGYIKQTFTLSYAVQLPGDQYGENALIGANRTAGAAGSSGRGILEISEVIASSLRQTQETTGIKIISRRRTDPKAAELDDMGYVMARQTIIEAKCTDARYYHPPLRVAGAGGVGTATITWADPPTRWDGVSRTLRIRRAVGATPPATVTDGSQVADVARGVQTYADAIAAGTYSYTVFAGYSDSGAASNERYSDGTAAEEGISAASVVVT